MNQDSSFDVRIPERYLDMLNNGEITASMLLTVTVLYKWGNWTTGRVKKASAGGLRTWTGKAYSERTFSEALHRLELMGEITRHTVPGSHKDYPITLHNYKKYDDAGKVTILNPKQTKLWSELQQADSDVDSRETSDETSYEASEETAGRLREGLILNESESSLKNDSEHKSQNEGLVSQQASQQADVVSGFSEEKKKELGFTYSLLGWGTGENDSLLAAFGVRYALEIHEESLWMIADWLKSERRDVAWIVGMVRWAHTHNFWKKRIVTVAALVKALDNNTETGLVAQYEVWVSNAPKSLKQEKKKYPCRGCGTMQLAQSSLCPTCGDAAHPEEAANVGMGFQIEED